MVCAYSVEGLPQKEVAAKVGFRGVGHMRWQLARRGPVDKLLAEEHEPGTKTTLPRGKGQRESVRPARDAAPVFEDVITKLARFAERLALRREHRQGNRYVVSNAKPVFEPGGPGENVGDGFEAPPNLQPNEHGVVHYTLDRAWTRVAGGAARYPDGELTAAVAAALLMGASTDELLEALYDDPPEHEVSQEVREKALILLKGNTDSTRRDSLENKARQMAAPIRGRPIGQGNRTKPVSKEEHAAAKEVRRRRERGWEDDEIARLLNGDDAYWPEVKKHRKLTAADVRNLGSLDV